MYTVVMFVIASKGILEISGLENVNSTVLKTKQYL